jgi:S-adenosylmethionine-dependent methyltransferase
VHIEVDQERAGADRFARERASSGRLAPVFGVLTSALPGLARSATGAGDRVFPTVLDCGGGSGTFAVPLAAAGADVTVIDISADALATLARRADEAGVSALVHPVQGDAEALSELVSGARYDLVLAHGILEAFDDMAAPFGGIADAVRPGGLLSVLVNNPAAAVVARALAGELDAALDELAALDSTASRTGPDAVVALCSSAGFVIEQRQGVGVFADLVPGAVLDGAGARETLARLDAAAASRSPFADIAGRVHLLARRPDGGADGPRDGGADGP